METKVKVFVSYTLRDNLIDGEFLSQLELVLKTSFAVFIDYLHNDSVEKQKRIEIELANSDFILLIKTNKTYNSEWVLKEINLAKELKIPIFEFYFEDLINNNFKSIKSNYKRWLVMKKLKFKQS